MREDLRRQNSITAIEAPGHAIPQHRATLRGKFSAPDRIQHVNKGRITALAVHLLQVKALLDQCTPQRGLKTKPRSAGSGDRTHGPRDMRCLGDRWELEEITTKHNLYAAHEASLPASFDGNAVQYLQSRNMCIH